MKIVLHVLAFLFALAGVLALVRAGEQAFFGEGLRAEQLAMGAGALMVAAVTRRRARERARRPDASAGEDR